MLSDNARESLVDNADPTVEQSIRTNLRHAVISAAAFLAPRKPGREVPRTGHLLKSNDFDPAQRHHAADTEALAILEHILGVSMREDRPQHISGRQLSVTQSVPTIFAGINLNRQLQDGTSVQGGFNVWLERE
jgi:hypothetical protein